MTHSTEFTSAELTNLDVATDEVPNSEPAAQTFDALRDALVTTLGDTAWCQRYIWQNKFTTPYIGPNNPTESTYLWLGLVDEHYKSLPRASQALQIEFGVDADTTSGFLGREVIWGILLGPWADDDVTQAVTENIRTHSHRFVQFLFDNDDYVLQTKTETFIEPNKKDIEACAAEIDSGFAITRNLTITDLPDINAAQTTFRTLAQLTPVYRLLAGIENAPSVTLSSERIGEPTDHSMSSVLDWDIDSLAAATELDASDIERSLENLTADGCSQDEALKYISWYLQDMIRGEGLFAVSGVGPQSGRFLVERGIKTVKDLATASPWVISQKTPLSEDQAQHYKESAQNNDFTSLEPANENIAEALCASANPLRSGDVENCVSHQRDTPDLEETDQSQSPTSSPESHDENNSSESVPEEQASEQGILCPEELPVPSQDSGKNVDGVEVYPNYVSEYYEALREARTVLKHFFQLDDTDIDPDNYKDPRIQYFVLLDACIGFGDPSLWFTGYGHQQQNRLPFTINDYRKAFGDGNAVTKYQAINVKPFNDETHALLRRKAAVTPSVEYVRPCAPGTNIALPELPGSFTELQDAMRLLGTFPAYPPLPTESGINDRTIPIAEIYQVCFGDVDTDYQVELGPLTTDRNTPPTGPVTDATPTSTAEAESKLLDYGRLSHLYRRVNPPTKSPSNRALNVFGLEWYRSKSPSFDALTALAKHGENEPVDTFRPRVQDLIHRRFLLDDWEYDYITVFPGHEAGSLSPQLVELAQDAVLETNIIYTPLLERTETVERQREKSESERRNIAIEPSASLRARARLNGETILLLDDICTTGSSLVAGAHLLRQAGAGRVVGLTLGFTPGGPQQNVTEIKHPEAVASEIIAGVNQ